MKAVFERVAASRPQALAMDHGHSRNAIAKLRLTRPPKCWTIHPLPYAVRMWFRAD